MTNIVGNEQFSYQADANWAQFPEGYHCQEVVGTAINSQNVVYVFNRGEIPVMTFASDGTLIDQWTDLSIQRAHGISILRDDTVVLTDDVGHQVSLYTPNGELIRHLSDGAASDTGVENMDYRTIKHGGPPFNYPTNVVETESGDLFIVDGYGNARVHHFDADYQHVNSWGEPGAAAGEFNVPHGIDIDENGVLYICDRENTRIQRYSQTGELIDIWTDTIRPAQIFIHDNHAYVSELGYKTGMFAGDTPPAGVTTGGRCSIYDRDGNVVCRWGGGADPCAPGDFYAPHDITVDRDGNIYYAEVVWSAGGRHEEVMKPYHTLQKFTRI